MKLMIIAVGIRMSAWVDEGFAEYAKRMPRTLPLALAEVKPEPRVEGKPVARLLEAEAGRIHAALPRGCAIVALDEHGRDMDTQTLAKYLERAQGDGRDLAFIIGGPDGLAPAIKSEAQTMLRLSSMTLPHGLARVLLAEQLYRAVSILGNHPYHRE